MKPVFGSLAPAEQARQLANPVGAVGLEVAGWLNGNNRTGNARALELLDVHAGCHVLEIGFGNGRQAPEVLRHAAGVRYSGIDISSTMVEEANRYNAALVAAGHASFRLGSADRMPFPDATFDRVLCIGVIHFWKDPLATLREVVRVMRPGALAIMGALDMRAAPDYAREEYGFYLRSAAEWALLCRNAGFASIEAQNVESEQITADGAPTKRYTIRLTLRR